MKAPRSQKSGITCTPPEWLQSTPRSVNSVDDATEEDALTGGGFRKIIGTHGLTDQQIHRAIERGAKFVVFQYCISVVFMTFKRSSDVYLIRPGHAALTPRIGYSILSLLLGWWGFLGDRSIRSKRFGTTPLAGSISRPRSFAIPPRTKRATPLARTLDGPESRKGSRSLLATFRRNNDLAKLASAPTASAWLMNCHSASGSNEVLERIMDRARLSRWRPPARPRHRPCRLLRIENARSLDLIVERTEEQCRIEVVGPDALLGWRTS